MPRANAASAANPFDAIAKKAAPAAKGKAPKVAATVTDAIRTAVDQVISLKAEEKRIEAERKQAEDAIRAHVQPQQDDLGFRGDFTGTMEVAGNQGSVLYVASDRFSVPKDEAAQGALRDLLGSKFDECFESRRTITLKPEAAENRDVIQKIVSALERAGFALADAFEVTDTLQAKKGLLEHQYRVLTKTQLEQLRTLVKPYSPAIK